jgi:ribosome-binding factor A
MTLAHFALDPAEDPPLTVERRQRLASLLRDELNQMIQRELEDPRLDGVSVTRVELSADCRNGRVLFTLLGDQAKAAAVGQVLTRATGFMRRRLGRNLHIRQVPELLFRHDRILHEATEVRLLIDRVVERDREAQRARGELVDEPEDGEPSGGDVDSADGERSPDAADGED